MTLEEFARQDKALRHAIQTGVDYEQQTGIDAWFYRNNPHLAVILKHLRTGVNCAMCEHATMSRLLLEKGVITEAEFYDASLKTLQEEVTRCEEKLSEHFGKSIRLG